jgi:glycine/D-amino acid oxidase-like deaminating enzyme
VSKSPETPGAGPKEAPYWTDPNPLPETAADQALPAKTDVLIIGGGYTGLSAALRLRKSAVAATVIDKEQIGLAASSRNGGMVLTGLSGGLQNWISKFGREQVGRFFAESLDAIDCVQRLVADGRIECHFTRCGHLKAAYKPAHLEALKREHEVLQSAFDHHTIVLPSNELGGEINTSYYHGGLIDPRSASIHPAKYMAGLRRMASAAGADLHAGACAQHIEPVGNQFQVSTNRGTIRAGQVLVATNAYTGRLTPWLQRRVVPVESMMIATEELPLSMVRELIAKDRMIFDTKHFLFYFRLSPDGRHLLFGGRPKSIRNSLAQNARIMYRDMVSVFPQLAQYRVTHAWSGKVGFTWDRFPHIGQRDGLFYAMGYCGHGVAMATYLGQKVAEMMLGTDDGTAFAANRFPAIPFYNGTPWFLPLAHRYFKTLDRLT